jgi:hypothetical protein
LDKEKSKHACLAQQNEFWPSTSARTVCWGWQMAQQSLTHAVEWLDGFIGPDGLPLVVSHLLQFQFL